MRQILNSAAARNIISTPADWRLVYRGGGAKPAARPPPAWQNWMRVNLHEHSCLDIMVVLCGHGWYGLDGKIYVCRPGTIFVFLPHQPHPCGYPPDHGDFEHLWIGIMHGEALTRVVSGRRGRLNYKDQKNSVISLEHCGLPCPVLLPPDNASPMELRLRFMALTASLLAGVVSSNLQRAATLPDRQTMLSRKIAAIRRHIMDTGGSDAHLDHLAHMAGYSKFHFLRVFKQETGQTVHDYTTQCRRQKARELRDAGLSMKEIAAQLGFASPSAFSHWHRNTP